MTSIKEIAWIAGILEGEASFGFSNSGRSPTIWIAMTDMDIVERLRVLTDSSKIIVEAHRKEYKPIYKLTLHGKRAIEWMMTIYSFMGIRRKAKFRQIFELWKITHVDESLSRSGKRQPRSQQTKNRQSFSMRFRMQLRKQGYSDGQIEIAKVLSAQGLSEDVILSRLEELKITGVC